MAMVSGGPVTIREGAIALNLDPAVDRFVLHAKL
jgi:hypothetical protein